MAGGNTPRQKMINMMYLVLTAMLALNVSAEVLDAFVKIEQGLQQTSEISAKKSQQTIDAFELAAQDNRTRVEKWQKKALDVQERTNELTQYIYDLKLELIRKGDGEKTAAIVDGKILPENIEAKDNTDAVNRILIGSKKDGKAYELKKMLEDYKSYVLNDVLKDLNGTDKLVDEINGLLNLEIDTKSSDGRTWETFTFEGMPLMSGVAMLTKIQVDVQNCESSIYDYLFSQIDASSFKFTGLAAIVKPTTSTAVIKGSDFGAEIYLGAYDESQQFTANLNIGTYQSDNSGKITLRRRGDGIGMQRINGSIKYKGPDGDMSIPVNFEYQVVEPNLVVSPDKMNVFYRGIQNPVSISVAGVPMDKLNISISNATSTKDASGVWMVTPGAGNECIVTVTADIEGTKQTMPTRKFRVKNVPAPTPVIHGIPENSKTATKGELTASQGMQAKMPPDFEFELTYSIVSYTVATSSGGYYKEESTTGNTYSAAQKALINGTKSGDVIMFTNVKAKGPSGNFDLNDKVIKVR